ncbi:hypothetical protein [Maritimibacter sp. UBA3975]|uniref:hypothetical protein n=1 Tax=Maritimibacter sp. UBA3975 TaxID=1946833 RepID=UPI000C0B555F|nr:hypothetical protein [Maritimibacter sp. UBA3975]MAM60914.1 hypothetical protein [Maritimibacter sp.]|tara:strand:+ start:12404 stop:12811 length:408 start_codon:yes stop_codon:yes gene_type:complete
MNEDLLGAILCVLVLKGEAESHHRYENFSYGELGEYSTYFDCETDTHVWEFGLDRRSSFDSLHQAGVAADISGKIPAIAIIDTNRTEDRFEMQVEKAARYFGVEVQTYTADYLIRWQMTDYLRNYPDPVPASLGR